MRFAFLLLSALLTVACTKSERKRPALSAGAQLYLRSCSGCHGPSGKGQMRMGLRSLPRDLSDPELHRARTDAQLAELISNGKNQMPPFKHVLSAAEIEQVVKHLRTLPRTERTSGPGAGEQR